MSKEIDWSKTKFDFCLYRPGDGEGKFVGSKPEITGDNYTIGSRGWDMAYWELRERPTKEETKPVYTQLMADNCEPPKSGMKILVLVEDDLRASWHEAEVLFYGAFTAVLTTEHVKERSLSLGDFNILPIDSRSDKQKLDDALDQFSYKKETWTHMSFTEAVDLGHIPYLKYTGEK